MIYNDSEKIALPKVNIAGVWVSSARTSQVLRALGNVLDKDQGRFPIVIATPNPEQVVQASRDREFSEFLNTRVDVAIPDGIGLVWASRILTFTGKINRSIPERVAGVEVATELLMISAEKNKKVLILGGEYQGRGEEVTNKLQSLFGLKNGQIEYNYVAGNIDEYLLEGNQAEMRLISKYRPDVIMVAFGAPRQERWIEERLPLLEDVGVRIVMSVGGTLDFWMGKVKRAPDIMQRLGLEWLWRLVLEPWRWRRQLRLIEFVGLVGKQMFGR